MSQSDAAIRRCWQEWVENGRFWRLDGRNQPRATADREDRLIVKSAVTASDSSLSTIRPRSDWSHADWGPIVFSNESCFQLCPDDHRGPVWGSPGQRADPAFTIVPHTGPEPGVIVWDIISFDSRTPLTVIRTHLQHSGTTTKIQRTVLLPFP
ncbi:HTH_Tnp_Tc3_2 domain-containing protein [Trichonephila clavipes]|nr:HTH_Tnp_Tc3_2 domain-containing protein [Trichonephila clavipes]